MEKGKANILVSLAAGERQALADRDPPVNYEAEQALLAAILANNRALDQVSDFLEPRHFADPVHGRIFEACRTLIERGQIANAITLKNLFDSDGALADVGGAQYLAQLQGSYVSIINAADYGRTVHDLFLRRSLIGLGENMVNDAFDYDPARRALEQIEKAESDLFRLAESGQTEGGLQEFRQAITQSILATEAAFKRDGKLVGVPSGFVDLDRYLGGLHKSDLIVLAGRPSMGKTALATNIAFNAASSERREVDAEGNEHSIPEVVAFFSLEMSAEQLATRIISDQVAVRSDAMRRGEISREEWTRLVEASRMLQSKPLHIDDTPALTIPALRTRARRLKRQHGLSLIVVDYLQLMQSAPGNRHDSRVQEVSEITRGLKAIAKELNVPVLALSQLSRAVEQRDDKRPQLADLRESGSIEQDADVVIFIFREEYYLSRENPSRRATETEEHYSRRVDEHETRLSRSENVAEVIIAKQRHGPIGTVRLHFNGEFTRFSDLAREDHLPDGH